MIKFTNQKECGDATSWYDVIIPQDWTMRDFIAYVVHKYAVVCKEWGTIKLASYRGCEGHIVEYDGRNGKCGTCYLYAGEAFMNEDQQDFYLENSRKLYNQYIDCKVRSVRANGGWGVMDYILTMEVEENG